MKIISVVEKPWEFEGKRGMNYKFSCLDPSNNEAFIYVIADKDVQLMCQVYQVPNASKLVGKTVLDSRDTTTVYNGRQSKRTVFLALQ